MAIATPPTEDPMANPRLDELRRILAASASINEQIPAELRRLGDMLAELLAAHDAELAALKTRITALEGMVRRR
jgi:hypothetical protein